jgi:hypothetical protein
LAAFDSLDDGVTIDDLAAAMESRVSQLEASVAWNTSDTGVICHSTGAIIARRWILNRAAAGKPLPSHLVTLAGANHGSTLAHMGKSVLGYFQKLVLHHELSVGQGVLTDLEYGSDFLLRLNAEWLDAWNSGRLDGVFAFTIIGDSPGRDPTVDLMWQTHEPGSDNTVRNSGTNLNYTIIDAQHDEDNTSISAVTPSRPVPHLVVPGYSHFGTQTGIMGSVTKPSDPPVQAVCAALDVATPLAYTQLQQTWKASVDAWSAANPGLANSTLIFTLLDRNGTSITDCMIAILDQDVLGDAVQGPVVTNPQAFAAAAASASKSLLHPPPLQNDSQRGSYAFHLNFAGYLQSSPHWFQIDIASDALVGLHRYPYPPLVFTQPSSLVHAIAPNECTYVRISLGKPTDAAYAVFDSVPGLNASLIFPPFDPANRLAP